MPVYLRFSMFYTMFFCISENMAISYIFNRSCQIMSNELQIVPISLLEDFQKNVPDHLSIAFEKLKDAEISTDLIIQNPYLFYGCFLAL